MSLIQSRTKYILFDKQKYGKQQVYSNAHIHFHQYIYIFFEATYTRKLKRIFFHAEYHDSVWTKILCHKIKNESETGYLFYQQYISLFI